MEWIVLILIGIAGSSLGSLIGLGGGMIIVPALLFLCSLSDLGISLLRQQWEPLFLL